MEHTLLNDKIYVRGINDTSNGKLEILCGHLSKSHVDVQTILLFAKLFKHKVTLHLYLNLVIELRLMKLLPSIILDILNNNITNRIEWINSIMFDNYNTVKNYSFALVLKELIYKHNTPEVREELKRIYNSSIVNRRSIKYDIIDEYINLQEEV